MKHLDLFSGIGGFALAARWMGWETVAFCEIEPFCRKVLAKNFPGVPIHDDIHTLDVRELHVDLVTGGFPCQPHSVAGSRRGRDDARHLWPQFARIIEEARSAWVVVENVPGLRTTAADEVLADLESLGYACWPLVVGAVHAGAPHRRQRVWIVANANAARLEVRRGVGRDAEPQRPTAERGRYQPDWLGWTDAPQPAVRRLDDGLPGGLADGCRVQKLKALGNAIVPQVAYEIFRSIDAALCD
jgi:DNA (cytosine-5)-methyltransferase 1